MAEVTLPDMPAPHDGTGDLPRTLWEKNAECEDLGLLGVPSGTVVVCDAGVLSGGVEVIVPAGDYLVRLQTDGAGTNVAAVLLRPDAEPVAFEEVGTYGVDAGMSGFFDRWLHERLESHAFPGNIYDDLIADHLDPAEARGHAGAMVPFGGEFFSACRSGGGDGVYPVYVGRDAGGRVVAVVTTF